MPHPPANQYPLKGGEFYRTSIVGWRFYAASHDELWSHVLPVEVTRADEGALTRAFETTAPPRI